MKSSKNQEDKRIVGFTAGSWDLFHAGHVLFLNSCKLHCDHLVVGLQTDPTIDRIDKNKPIQGMYERWTQVYAHRAVDLVIPYDTEHDLLNLLKTCDFDVRFLGSDYDGKAFTGSDLEMKLMLVEREHDYSSTNLRMRICKEGI